MKSILGVPREKNQMETVELKSKRSQTESFDPEISRHSSCPGMDEISDVRKSFVQLAALVVSIQDTFLKERDAIRIFAEEIVHDL